MNFALLACILFTLLAVVLVVWITIAQKLSSMIIYCIGAPFSGKSKSKFSKYFLMKLLGTGDLLRTIAKLSGDKLLSQDELTNAVVLALSILRYGNPELSDVENEEILRIARIQRLDVSVQRSAIALAISIRRKMEKMELIPDEWVIALFRGKIDLLKTGIMVDGIPRTLSQAQTVQRPNCVIHYYLPVEQLHERAHLRALQEPHRPDNDSTKFDERIDQWLEVEQELLSYYRERQVRIIHVSSSGPYWWGIIKTIWAFAKI